jgi:hypothetical protein
MAFLGYLLKINGLILPNRFIAIKTYTTTPNQIQDEDSYIDLDGVLDRSTLPHRRSKCEFNTPPINETDNHILQSYFPEDLKIEAEYWNPRKGIYETGTFYNPDITFTVESINEETNQITYEPIRLALIEY